MLKEEWEAFASCVAFFTRFPISPRIFRLDKGIFYLPFVAFLLGGLSFFLAKTLAPYIPPKFLAFFLLVTGYFVADFFHFDGLLDWADALASYGDRQKKLAIMKTPEVGALGVLFAFFFLLGEYLLTLGLLEKGLFLAFLFKPLAGRLASALIALMLPPAKKEGLGFLFVSGSRKRLWASQVFWLLLFYFAPLPTAFTLLLVFALSRSFKKDFGGLTGDLLGATIMLCQWLFLAGFLFANF
ncbi:adenosylcobinamide-GDP ribazoletransferase [Thermodesulfatator atlanticus]|uniref:adenosylcobinamide-GDP ribazoletransferase n=1 Tax=Thermodesulfatator atlanticus TaxID=501497 RepID=UPI0003B785B0|nr:adenosylcobinamide-GDP ribazoletransferase [Thermodesulfatator atlanticus]